jgi:uncharacterized protein YjbJ (UPF0337 family)
MSFGDKVSHKTQELRGRMKRNAGEVTNNPRLQAEGRSEEMRGGLKQAAEKVKDAFGFNRRPRRRRSHRDNTGY